MSNGTDPSAPSNPSTSPCPCAQPQDPQVVSNPPGLAQISYRVDDFTGFRRALLRPLPGEQAISAWRPAPGDLGLQVLVSAWRPAAGDLGLQVLEWWAYLGDVLTFYNERIANESYLRTATQQSSIANLVALLGYQPAPGIAATGNLAATRSAAHPDEPLVIPAGMPVSSVATPGVPSQTFEVDAAASFTGPSNVPVTLPADTTLLVGADGTPQSVLLAGPVSGISAGDQLVLADSSFAGKNDNWSLVTVGSITLAADPGTGVLNTLVTFSASARGPAPVPPLPGQSTSYRLLRPAAATALWNRGAPAGGQPIVAQTGATVTVQLSAITAISPGDMVLFDCGAGSPSALAQRRRDLRGALGRPLSRASRRVRPEPAGHRRRAHCAGGRDHGLRRAGAGRPGRGHRPVRLPGHGHDHRGPGGDPGEPPGDRRGPCALRIDCPRHSRPPPGRDRGRPPRHGRPARDRARLRSPGRAPRRRRSPRLCRCRSSCCPTFSRCRAGRR